MSRKRRSDAKLHALPEPVKEQLIRWLTEENVSYETAKERLEMDFNVRVSVGALCDFYATECYLQTSASAQEFVTRVEAEVKADGRAYDAATMKLVRQRAYMLARTQGASVKDLATLAGIIGDAAKLELKAQEVAIAGRRLALLEKKAAQADAAKGVADDETLTDEQRTAKLRQIFRMA